MNELIDSPADAASSVVFALLPSREGNEFGLDQNIGAIFEHSEARLRAYREALQAQVGDVCCLDCRTLDVGKMTVRDLIRSIATNLPVDSQGSIQSE